MNAVPAVELIIKYIPESGTIPSTGSKESKQDKEITEAVDLVKRITGQLPGGSQALGLTNAANSIADAGKAIGGGGIGALSGTLVMAQVAYRLAKKAYDTWYAYDLQHRQSAELTRRAGYSTRG